MQVIAEEEFFQVVFFSITDIEIKSSVSIPFSLHNKLHNKFLIVSNKIIMLLLHLKGGCVN